jgi:hypothetical protein
VGEYQDRLGAESKVHGWEQRDDGSEVLLCGPDVPSYQDGYKLIVAKCCTSTRKGVLLVLRLKLKN